ncbi:uncharacterized protein ASPGLDRAFT_881991 [Aspergillus glaucus CBS 516.65]|uniref:Uncharacterized protein n=1 Tax=Aspergillus glaucus CBS 516.65 TaxID=1160497 RepID=A0A1L9V8C5_ASPGL|nr:hypothetical protein ASPGLDRAFT_881991 [Aspergillus glaucus CBS 516.65]OJJ80194.1 hypothetical protein ASPGLDRAFT_881991 [Aspergillus glaucus CBS 516.65]
MRALLLLTIHLNVSSCEQGAPCCRGHRVLHDYDCDSYYGKPLGPSVSKLFMYAMLFEWYCAIEEMSKHIPPSQLQLFLVCDVEDIDIAKKVLRPLLKLPILANCNIRLSRDQDSSLYNLERQAATQAVGQIS